jgi:hypothetical protein
MGWGGNLVGGNLISGNGGNGIRASGPASLGNLILGNKIGTDVTGETSAIPNSLNGVLVDNTSGMILGGVAGTTGNLISGNGQDGVKITGNQSSGIFVIGNRIGTDQNGAAAIANQGAGVELVKQAHGNIVGVGNVISGNLGDGVQIDQSNSNAILGDRIGTDLTGTIPLPNHGHGVEIVNRSSGNVIGGTGTDAPNVISGNLGDGVRIAQTSNTNSLLGNLIGTDVSGSAALGNHFGSNSQQRRRGQSGRPGDGERDFRQLGRWCLDLECQPEFCTGEPHRYVDVRSGSPWQRSRN